MNGILTPTYAPVSGFPAAAVVAAILFTAVGSLPENATPQTQSVAPGTATVTFSDLAADTWTFTASPVDASGAALTAAGYSAPSTSLAITAPQTVTLTVPTALSAAQA